MTTPEKIQTALQQLHEALQEGDALDDDARRQLSEAADEIQDALHRSELPEQAPQLAARLQESLEKFEASHPMLTGILSQLVNALNLLGI